MPSSAYSVALHVIVPSASWEHWLTAAEHSARLQLLLRTVMIGLLQVCTSSRNFYGHVCACFGLFIANVTWPSFITFSNWQKNNKKEHNLQTFECLRSTLQGRVFFLSFLSLSQCIPIILGVFLARQSISDFTNVVKQVQVLFLFVTLHYKIMIDINRKPKSFTNIDMLQTIQVTYVYVCRFRGNFYPQNLMSVFSSINLFNCAKREKEQQWCRGRCCQKLCCA